MANSEMWKAIKTVIQSKSYKDVHKMIWEEYAVISSRGGQRYKITADWNPQHVERLLDEVKNQYYAGPEWDFCKLPNYPSRKNGPYD